MPPSSSSGPTAVGGATLVASMSLPGLPRDAGSDLAATREAPDSPSRADPRAATGDFLRRRFRPVSIASAIVILLLAAGATRLRVGQSMVSAFDEGHEIVRADTVLNELFDGTYFHDVFIEAEEAGGLCEPRALRSIEELEEAAKKLPHVKGSISIAGFSRKLNQILHDWDPKEHRIPDDAATAREQFALLDASPSKKADFLRTVDPTYTRANVRLRLSRPAASPTSASSSRRSSATWPKSSRRATAARDPLGAREHGLCLGPPDREEPHRERRVLARARLPAPHPDVPPAPRVVLLRAARRRRHPGDRHATMASSTSSSASARRCSRRLAMGVGVNFPIHVLDRLRHAILIEGRSEGRRRFATALPWRGRRCSSTACRSAWGSWRSSSRTFRSSGTSGS
jgi:hypothetical protein